ncbi:MAG: hypothetical protein KJZ93_12060 [Caldilineaceae bacterium]|nr:hypothetical protein [Caldilineaceae bacterium]
MNNRRIELLIMFLTVLALNWLGTMWWLSGPSFPTAQASEQAQTGVQEAVEAQAAAIPRTFGYQGTLRLADGSLANGNFNITIKLYSVAGGGNALYSETINNVVARDGLFSVVIGGNSEVPASVFDNTPLYLGIAVAPDPEMVPRQRLYPVPWAMQATTANIASALTPGAGMAGVLTLGSGGKVIAFARDGGDDANAGKIAYKASWDNTALSIVGAGAAGARKVRLYDNVTVDKDLAVSGNLAVAGSLSLNSDFSVNAIREIGDSKGNPKTSESYAVSTRRYVLEAKDAGNTPHTVPVDDAILTAFCQDVDGCTIRVGMRDWDPARGKGDMVAIGPTHFIVSANRGNGTRDWTYGNGAAHGNDGNGGVNHVAVAHNACYFTDGEYFNGIGTDTAQGFGLLNWHGVHDSSDMVCVLIIED